MHVERKKKTDLAKIPDTFNRNVVGPRKSEDVPPMTIQQHLQIQTANFNSILQ